MAFIRRYVESRWESVEWQVQKVQKGSGKSFKMRSSTVLIRLPNTTNWSNQNFEICYFHWTAINSCTPIFSFQSRTSFRPIFGFPSLLGSQVSLALKLFLYWSLTTIFSVRKDLPSALPFRSTRRHVMVSAEVARQRCLCVYLTSVRVGKLSMPMQIVVQLYSLQYIGCTVYPQY